MKKFNCPYCEINLKEEGLKFVELALVAYDVSVCGGHIHYEISNVENGIEGNYKRGFACPSCGEILDLNEKKVIKIFNEN